MSCLLLVCVVLLAGGCLLDGPSFDYYDDSLRGTHELPVRVRFGQSIGPDGDGCWPEDRQRGGTVFCDLVSVGGLHWDSGDVHVSDALGRPAAAISLGSGWCACWTRMVRRGAGNGVLMWRRVPLGSPKGRCSGFCSR